MEKLKPYASLILGGFLYTLAYPNIWGVIIPPANLVGVGILFLSFLKNASLKENLKSYLIFNLTIVILSFTWITQTLMEFGQLHFIIAAFANILFIFILNIHYWALIFILWMIRKYLPNYKILNTATGSTLAAIFLTLLEYYVPQQFPVMLGQPWIVLGEYLGLAPYLGLPAFSFFGYLLISELIRKKTLNTFSKINITAVILFILLNPLFNKNYFENSSPKKFNIRLVQANISNFLKVDSETGRTASVREVLSRYEKLSKESFKNGKKIDLIVWPETAYPFPIYTNKIDKEKTQIPDIFNRIIKQTNAEMLFGGYDHYKKNPDGSFYRTEYNAAIHLNQKGLFAEAYHKHILIPFGETLPLGPLTETASKYFDQMMAFFAIGDTTPVFHTKSGIKFIANICYEILQPEFLRSSMNEATELPHMMINLTNDSWYGNTTEPEQHLFLARWRALEFKVPILRSTNTGISTYIDTDGQEVQRLEYGVAGNLDLELKLPKLLAPTLFQHLGIMAILPIWGLLFLFHFLLIKFRYEK